MSFPQYPAAFALVQVPANRRSVCKFSGGDSFNPPINALRGESWAFASTIPGWLYSDQDGGPDLAITVLPVGPSVVTFSEDVGELRVSDKAGSTGWCVAWRLGE